MNNPHQRLDEQEVKQEIADFDSRARKRKPPQKKDIIQDYYLPLTTFGAEGTRGVRGDNKVYFYKRHLDHLREFQGKKVLNVACGVGDLSLYLAHIGCEVTAFDFSPASVEYARESARVNGFADRIQTDLMDIRELDYPSDTFDLVTGEAALHHVIKYENCFENLYRVLKPGGVAVFVENFVFDPLIRLMRPVNWLLKGYVGEYSLRKEDLEYAASVFDRVELTDQAVFYTYSRFFYRPTPLNRRVAALLKQMDDAVLTVAPFMKRFHSLAYLQLHKTRSSIGQNETRPGRGLAVQTTASAD